MVHKIRISTIYSLYSFLGITTYVSDECTQTLHEIYLFKKLFHSFISPFHYLKKKIFLLEISNINKVIFN
jgi:hypothetical protein